MPGSYKAYADFNGDGDFSDASEDVTGRVLDSRAPITFRYGRDQARALAPIAPGEGQLIMDNSDRALSPENTSSPLYDQLVPGRQVKIDIVVSGVTTTLLRAQTDDTKNVPGTDNKHVEISLIDGLGTLRGASVSTAVHQGLRTGEAIGVLLDAVGWPAALRDLDVGATVMPFWWLDNDDAYSALMDLVASEGPPALVTVDSSNRIVFRDRHHRLQRAASTTVQSTWRSGDPEPSFSEPTDYNHGWKEIVNSVAFQAPLRALSADTVVVFSSQGSTSVASGETVAVVAQGSAPFVGLVTPVDGTDFTVVSGVVTVALSRTSGASTTVFVTAVGGPAVIRDLQLRGRSVDTVTTVQISGEHGGSVLKYGRRSLPDGREPKWAGLGDAKAIVNVILGARSERLATISVTMRAASNPVRLAQQISRDLSDRVHVVESHTGLDADCFVEQIAHSIGEGGLDHVTTFGMEKAPAQITGVFILGSAANGVLGTNRLGRTGLMDAATVFTLGSATNGVLGTNLLGA